MAKTTTTTMKSDDAAARNPVLLEPREAPKPALLLQGMANALHSAVGMNLLARMETAHDVLNCRWDGQTDDCRNWRDKAEPHKGASDQRVRLAQETADERLDMLASALRQARLTVLPADLSPEDHRSGVAAVWQQVADYYLAASRGAMMLEGELVAANRLHYGVGLLYVGWEEKTALMPREVSREDVVKFMAARALEAAETEAARHAAEAQDAGEEITDHGTVDDEMRGAIADAIQQEASGLFLDPAKRKNLAAVLQAIDPEMPADEATRAARTLQTVEGSADYFAPTVVKAGPLWKSYTLWVDAFLPPETTKVQEAPWISTVEWLSEPALRERITTQGYDKEWVDAVLAAQPTLLPALPGVAIPGTPAWALGSVGVGLSAGVGNGLQTGPSRLWPVLNVWYKASTKGGIPCVYLTVLSGSAPETWAKHEAQPYADGEYPFVVSRNERKTSLLVESRGVPELAMSAQAGIKLQFDARINRTALEVNPILMIPSELAGGKVKIKPGTQLTVPRTARGMIEWMRLPPQDGSSQQVEAELLNHHNRLFGRGAEVDPPVKMNRARNLVEGWLEDMTEAMRMTFRRIQEFGGDVRASAIAGMPVELEARAEDIQGAFDLELHFDAADMDMEVVGKKLGFIAQMLVPLDTEGTLDRRGLVEVAMRLISPSWARRLVRPAQAVQEDEVNDEDTAFAKLSSGIEAPFKLGVNHALRLERLQSNIQKNPEIQRRLQVDSIFAALVDGRMKKHQFQIDQVKNAQIGRQGGGDVLGE